MKKIWLTIAGSLFIALATVNAQDRTSDTTGTGSTQSTEYQSQWRDEDREQLMRDDLPSGLVETLESGQYEGWENATIYRNKSSNDYMLVIQDSGNTRTFYFDKEGKERSLGDSSIQYQQGQQGQDQQGQQGQTGQPETGAAQDSTSMQGEGASSSGASTDSTMGSGSSSSGMSSGSTGSGSSDMSSGSTGSGSTGVSSGSTGVSSGSTSSSSSDQNAGETSATGVNSGATTTTDPNSSSTSGSMSNTTGQSSSSTATGSTTETSSSTTGSQGNDAWQSTNSGNTGTTSSSSAWNKEDRVVITTNDLPSSLLITLGDPMYKGWDNSTVYRNRKTNEYMIEIRDGSDTRTYYFDKNGKATNHSNTESGVDE